MATMLASRNSNLSTFNAININYSTLQGTASNTITTRQMNYSTLIGSSIVSNVVTGSVIGGNAMTCSTLVGSSMTVSGNVQGTSVSATTITASTLTTTGNITVSGPIFANNPAALWMPSNGSASIYITDSSSNPTGGTTTYGRYFGVGGVIYQDFYNSFLWRTTSVGGTVSNTPMSLTSAGNLNLTGLISCGSMNATGFVGIGTASPSNLLNIYNTTGGWGITLNNINNGTAMNFLYNGGQVGTITINGSNTAYNTSSDRRLKTNINYQFDGLGLLQQLKPCSFNFIADGSNANTYHGFIAQDVQDILPQYIQTSPGMDWLMMDYKQLTGILAKAILQQNTTITSLQTTVQQQATEITALQATVATQSTQVLQIQVNAQQIQIAQLMQRLSAAGIA